MTIQLVYFTLLGFIFHFMGDYLLQTDYMANEKTKWWFPAFQHALVYSTPFIFITTWQLWFVVFITHFFIDRYRLAQYWVKALNNSWQSTNFGYNETTPIWLSMWLLFIVDNTFHIIINTICIFFSNHN